VRSDAGTMGSRAEDGDFLNLFQHRRGFSEQSTAMTADQKTTPPNLG